VFKDQNVHKVNVRLGAGEKRKGEKEMEMKRGTMVSGTVDVANER